MSAVEQSWQRIQTWLEQLEADRAAHIPGPASAEGIAAAEQAMGLSLPADLKESYATHDGQDYGEDELSFFPDMKADFLSTFCLLPIETVADEWRVWAELIDDGDFDDLTSEPAEGIREGWWSKRWIPVAGNGGGDFLCVDLDPAEGGTVGQVIGAWHDSDERTIIASSWTEYLGKLADEMESGRLAYDEDEGLVWTES